MGVILGDLTEENFLLYAIKAYDNPHCSGVSEFMDDLQRIKYVKRLLNRYREKGDLKERLIVNHLVVLHNLFGTAALPLLFFRISEQDWPQLKTFLTFLNMIDPDAKITTKVRNTDLPIDLNIVAKLRVL